MFLLVVLALLGGANAYVISRASRAFSLSRRTRRGLWIVAGCVLLLTLLSRVLGRVWPDAPFTALGAFTSVVEIGVLISAVLLGVTDLARLAVRSIGHLAGRLRPVPAPASASVSVPAPVAAAVPASVPAPVSAAVSAPAAEDLAPVIARRAFVSQVAAGSALLVGGGTAAYGGLVGRRDYVIEEVVVPIPGLPRALEGFTVVQLSDVHIGQFVTERELAAASMLVRDARPDVVVLTGDLLDHDERFAPVLGGFARRLGELAREGVVAIPGNHDYYAGIEATLGSLRSAGARVLVNDGLVIGDAKSGLALLGVDDVWAMRRRRGRGPDLQRAIASVPRDLPRVLLCHNPVYFPDAAGEVALQLSGHTHGGQVNLLVRPADAVLPHGYVAGMYERDGSRLYINRGFGTAGPPMRVGAPPEITRVVLVGA